MEGSAPATGGSGGGYDGGSRTWRSRGVGPPAGGGGGAVPATWGGTLVLQELGLRLGSSSPATAAKRRGLTAMGASATTQGRQQSPPQALAAALGVHRTRADALGFNKNRRRRRVPARPAATEVVGVGRDGGGVPRGVDGWHRKAAVVVPCHHSPTRLPAACSRLHSSSGACRETGRGGGASGRSSGRRTTLQRMVPPTGRGSSGVSATAAKKNTRRERREEKRRRKEKGLAGCPPARGWSAAAPRRTRKGRGRREVYG